jgi:hypothetical protein
VYQIITADAGDVQNAIMAGIGTVHHGEFAAMGELDNDSGTIYLAAECLVGPDEGRLLRAGPLELMGAGDSLSARYTFMHQLRLPHGVWKLYIVDQAGKPLPGRHRTVSIKDKS